MGSEMCIRDSVCVCECKVNVNVEVSRNAYMKLDEIKKLNHPILDLNDVFCVQGD